MPAGSGDDVGAVLVPILRALAPNLAARLPADFDVTLARVGGQSFAGRTIRFAHTIRLLCWLLPLLAGACFVLAVALARDRRRAVGHVGVAIVLAGLGVGVVTLILGAALASTGRGSLRGALTRAAWHQLTGFVWPSVVITLIAGLFVTTASTDLLAQAGVRAERAWACLWRRADTRPARWGRVALLAAFGALLLARPDAAARLITAAGGLALIAMAASQLSDIRGPGRADSTEQVTTLTPAGDTEVRDAAAPEKVSATSAASTPKEPRAGWRGRLRRVLGGRRGVPLAATAVVGVVLLVALVIVDARPTLLADAAPVAATPAQVCNGYAALCNRPYDDVAFPATHNSMSAADEPGWLFAEQPTGLIGQLNAGIRVLLIDTWLGQPTHRPGIVTTTTDLYAKALSETNHDLGPATVASALRVRDALGLTPTGPAQPYLCHGLCELGATLLKPVMAQVRTWLVAHPRDVVTFFIQDEGVTPEQTAALFQQTGLLPYVHTQRQGQPWPTLGQMIDSGRRLVLLMQNQDGGTAYPWQMPGFQWTQDTPYTFPSADRFSCDRLRGAPTSPLLLVNHWLSNPTTRITDSAAVNGYDVLWPRVTRCRTQRQHIPNFIAVDFYNLGDLLTIVNQLNAVS